MARRLPPERQELKAWAIELAGLGMTSESIQKLIRVKSSTIRNWLSVVSIVDSTCYITDSTGCIVHNNGVVVHNFSQGHPPHPIPHLLPT